MTCDRLAELLEQYDEMLRSGAPEVVTILDRAEAFDEQTRSDLEGAAECLRALDRMRRRRQIAGQPPAEVDGPPAEAPLGHGRRWAGRFEIVRELAKGGHGIVFLAWDPQARRQVALKTPRPELLFDEDARRRFLNEGIAAARLAHPNIVSVLEVGRSGANCYLVSAYSHGKSLATFLADHKEPMPLAIVAAWGAALADAVEHAHLHGILHRDLKPANVILERAPRGLAGEAVAPEDDESQIQADSLVPKLTDFGLAKLLDSQDARTRTGVMLGTPNYMAPEQVDASVGAVGLATDVYGLGAILYELLTGRPPFSAASQTDLLRQIGCGDPCPPRALRRETPRDLEAICLCALQRRPEDRYPTASALADDLRRFLAGEVTRARPLGLGGRTIKWSRRKPATAAALAVGILAAAIITGGALWHSIQLGQALAVAEEARTRAEAGEQDLRQLIYFRDMQAANEAIERHEVRKAAGLLERHASATSENQHGFLWRLLTLRCYGEPRRFRPHQGRAHSVDFTSDGQSLISAGSDRTVQIWNPLTGEHRLTLSGHTGEVNCVAVSPNGQTVASAGDDCQLRLWNIRDGSPLAVFTSPLFEKLSSLAWAPDGQTIAMGGYPGSAIVLWDVGAQSVVTTLPGHEEELNALAYSLDGRLLASAGSDGAVHVWDITTNRKLVTLRPEQDQVTCVQFSHDGRHLATAGVSTIVKVWDVGAGTLAASHNVGADRVDALAISPQSRQLLIGDSYGIVREWDWQKNLVLRSVDTRQGRLLSLACSRANSQVASAAVDGSVCVWDRIGGETVRELTSDGIGSAAAFSPDSRVLISAGIDGDMLAIDLENATARPLGRNPRGETARLAFTGASRFVTSSSDVVYRWELTGQTEPVALAVGKSRVKCMAVTPDAKLLLAGDLEQPFLIHILDAATGKSLGSLQGHRSAIHWLDVSPSGWQAASAGGDGTVRLWDLRQRKALKTFTDNGAGMECVAFSPDGRVLAIGGESRQVRFWDTQSGDPQPVVLNHPARVRSIAYCPNEPLLATGDNEGVVRLWSLNGAELMILGRLRNRVVNLAFSPNGAWLAAAAPGNNSHAPGQLMLWKAQ